MSQIHLNEHQSSMVRRPGEHVDFYDADGTLIGRIAPYPDDWAEHWMDWIRDGLDARRQPEFM